MEVWRTIKGYEGLYQVSNLGRVKSLSRYVLNKWKTLTYKKEVILKPILTSKGYYVVSLHKEGQKNYYVHQLVAQAFITNPDNYKQINHKNEIKTDNFVYVDLDGTINAEKSNLEWCSQAYNNTYGHRIEKAVAKQINGKKAKAVVQYTLEGELIREYPSTREVERQLGFSQANVAACCRNAKHRYTAYGYIWKYKEERAA